MSVYLDRKIKGKNITLCSLDANGIYKCNEKNARFCKIEEI